MPVWWGPLELRQAGLEPRVFGEDLLLVYEQSGCQDRGGEVSCLEFWQWLAEQVPLDEQLLGTGENPVEGVEIVAMLRSVGYKCPYCHNPLYEQSGMGALEVWHCTTCNLVMAPHRWAEMASNEKGRVRMPGPVSDSYDPVWGTADMKDQVLEVIREVRDELAEALGEPKFMGDVIRQEQRAGEVQKTLTEKQLRIARYCMSVCLGEEDL